MTETPTMVAAERLVLRFIDVWNETDSQLDDERSRRCGRPTVVT